MTYDADGWIKVDNDPPPMQAPPTPHRSAPIGLIVAVIVAVVAVVAAGIVLIPRGSHTPSGPSSAAAGTDDDPMTGDDDVLTHKSVLTGINVRFSDVGDGYEKAIAGAIDPLGGDGCAQPNRPFSLVAANHWTAYEYRPNGLHGLTLGVLASSVTVFDTEADAAKRTALEHEPRYAACLDRWDTGMWFEGSGLAPIQKSIVPLKVKLPTTNGQAWRYRALVETEGQQIPLYTDHIVFTKGRVRIWIMVGSALEPFGDARRDLLVSRLAARLDQALA